MAKTDSVTRQDIIDEVQKLRDTVDRWRVQTQAKVDRHEKTIYGNGNIGMDEQVRTIYATVGLGIKLMWIITGAVVSALVSGAAYAIIYIIRDGTP
jgi:hypothetical protein